MNTRTRFAVVLAGAAAFASAAAFAGPALADGLFAAIAFSPATGQAGSAWNYSAKTEAESEAAKQCGSGDCYTAVIFQQCGALAVGDGFGMGFAADASADKAQKAALANCSAYTTSCEVTQSACNDGY